MLATCKRFYNVSDYAKKKFEGHFDWVGLLIMVVMNLVVALLLLWN